MQRTYTPEALARREARKAETKARNEAKKVAAKAAKEAQWAAQRQAWQDAQTQRRIDFEANLSEQDKADLKEALSEPSSRIASNGMLQIANDWLHSVKQQYEQKGWLSPAQLAPLLRRVRQKREQAEKAKDWKEIQEGDVAKLYCTVVSVEKIQGTYGWTNKIRLLTSYGRKVSFKTGRQDWVKDAIANKEAGTKVFVVGKVTWVAPDPGGPFVLTSRGMKFGDLL